MAVVSIGTESVSFSVPYELGHELDDEHDLEVVALAEVRRVVLRERDVVVRVEDEDPLRADGAPVLDVVAREPLGLVEVAHLGGRAAAAPLLAHEAELDPGRLQHLGDRARLGGAVERRLAVAEEDRLAAGRQVEVGRPVADVLLGDRRLAVDDRLVLALVGQRVPALPARLLDARLDALRPDRLDEIDRARAKAVEVPREQRVRTAQLARPALRAVDVVASDLLELQQALVHRDDVRVERGRRMALVPRDLRDRADLTAELVARAVAVVGGVAPLVEELPGQPVGPPVRAFLVHRLGHRASLSGGAGTVERFPIAVSLARRLDTEQRAQRRRCRPGRPAVLRYNRLPLGARCEYDEQVTKPMRRGDVLLGLRLGRVGRAG